MNQKRWEYLFLLVGVLTILEFVYVRGMFTWLIAVAAVITVGLINIAYQLKGKAWSSAALYLITMTALCMGYFLLA